MCVYLSGKFLSSFGPSVCVLVSLSISPYIFFSVSHAVLFGLFVYLLFTSIALCLSTCFLVHLIVSFDSLVCLLVFLNFHASFSLSICIFSLSLAPCLSARSFIYLLISLFISYFLISLSLGPSVYLFPSVSLYFYPFVCLLVSLLCYSPCIFRPVHVFASLSVSRPHLSPEAARQQNWLSP